MQNTKNKSDGKFACHMPTHLVMSNMIHHHSHIHKGHYQIYTLRKALFLHRGRPIFLLQCNLPLSQKHYQLSSLRAC